MPYRYSADRFAPGSYHVWGRAKEGIWLFRDDEDRGHFESLVNRHLSRRPHFDSRGREVISLRDEVGLCARNLLSSHFHLVLWQKISGGIHRLMRRVILGYTQYYHRKYDTSGSLFPGPFRSDRLVGRKRFLWCVAYVHANHKRLLLSSRYSTHGLFLAGEDAPSWLEAERTLKVFGGLKAYEEYMARYLERKALDQDLRIDSPLF
jgi:hypothetical protein